MEERKWLDAKDIMARYGVSKNIAYRIIRSINHSCGGVVLCRGKVLLTQVEAWERSAACSKQSEQSF